MTDESKLSRSDQERAASMLLAFMQREMAKCGVRLTVGADAQPIPAPSSRGPACSDS